MMRRVWQAEKWDRADPKSLKGWPNIPWWTREAVQAGLHEREWTSEEFQRCRAEVLRHTERCWLTSAMRRRAATRVRRAGTLRANSDAYFATCIPQLISVLLAGSGEASKIGLMTSSGRSSMACCST
jgi:hypothetical protein